jgi:hypothetical protein
MGFVGVDHEHQLAPDTARRVDVFNDRFGDFASKVPEATAALDRISHAAESSSEKLPEIVTVSGQVTSLFPADETGVE